MINKVILGTAQFGLDYGINNFRGRPSKDDIFAILEFAKMNGVKTLDTADAYGTSKDIIGEYNRQNGIYFEINSKFHNSNLRIEENVFSSLEALRVSSFNTYFFHNFDDFKKAGNS